jgi:hypothetical protein
MAAAFFIFEREANHGQEKRGLRIRCIERPELAERVILFCQTMAEAKEEIRRYAASTFVASVRDEDILETLAEYGERVFVFECSSRVELTPFARMFEDA